jgi:hypothetical protein
MTWPIDDDIAALRARRISQRKTVLRDEGDRISTVEERTDLPDVDGLVVRCFEWLRDYTDATTTMVLTEDHDRAVLIDRLRDIHAACNAVLEALTAGSIPPRAREYGAAITRLRDDIEAMGFPAADAEVSVHAGQA